MKIFVIFSLFLGFLLHAQAQEAQTHYAKHQAAQAWAAKFAQKYQFDPQQLEVLLSTIKRDESVLEKISKPAEKSKPWFEYAKIFSDQERLDNGIAFYRQHQADLQRAYAQYGVEPSVIVAILGVETRYGKVTGKTGVLSALATLCFDYPPRAEFFCSELEYFLRLAQKEQWHALAIEGSYAGAMGMAQFMPSSYWNDAIDFDGDGKIDLWHSPSDAIGSIAHYLHKRGWVKDGALYKSLPTKPQLAIFDGNHKPSYRLHALAADENLKSNQDFMKWLESQPEETVGSLVLQGEQSEEAFIIYSNFFVITRYNTSPMYAMAVSNLAAGIQSSTNESN